MHSRLLCICITKFEGINQVFGLALVVYTITSGEELWNFCTYTSMHCEYIYRESQISQSQHHDLFKEYHISFKISVYVRYLILYILILLYCTSMAVSESCKISGNKFIYRFIHISSSHHGSFLSKMGVSILIFGYFYFCCRNY